MSDTLHTPLYDLHQKHGARMVDFAGYAMPVQYPDGIIKEHLHTRANAGLFDVSHMGQLIISGTNATEALEQLIPIDLESLEDNQQRYGLLLNEQGTILDDLIVTRKTADSFFVVVNAACKENDIKHLRQHLPESISLEHLENQALLALQGPQAHRVLQDQLDNLENMTFMQGRDSSLYDIPCYITRSGYTGEDGFEISVKAEQAEELAEQLLKNPLVKPIGLGARDSLRLEAGLCLYGHDMDTTKTPIEAGLLWSISKSRRPDNSKAGGYPGADIIAGQIEAGTDSKRVGILIEGRAPAREGAQIIDPDNDKIIGVITSGSFSPCLEQPIAMGYVEQSFAKAGTAIVIAVRKKKIPAVVHKLPFVKQTYYRG